jgi:hypothetical protein
VIERSFLISWLGPLSLVMYSVDFLEKPRHEAERVAERFRSQQTPERLAIIIREIKLEIAHQTQRVRDNLGSCASEWDLREYLSEVAEMLEAKKMKPIRELSASRYSDLIPWIKEASLEVVRAVELQIEIRLMRPYPDLVHLQVFLTR